MLDEKVLQLVSFLRETKTRNVLGEISLLFAWKYLQDQKLNSVLPLTDVYIESKSLSEVYTEIAEMTDKEGVGIFSDSKIHDKVSPEQMRHLVREVDKLPRFDATEIVEILYSLVSKELKHADEVTIPKYLVDIMVALSKQLSGEVYAPFVSSIQLAIRASSDQTQVTYQAHGFSLLVGATLLMSDIHFKKEDPFEDPITNDNGVITEFDTVLMIPPFGRKASKIGPDVHNRFSQWHVNGDVKALQHGLAQCSGRLIALVPEGILHRSGYDLDLRTMLIEKGILDTVINLPSPIFIQSKVGAAILIIDKKRKPDAPIMFCDLNKTYHEGLVKDILNRKESTYGTLKTRQDIRCQNHNLSVKKYILGKASIVINSSSKKIKLGEISIPIGGQSLRQSAINSNLQSKKFLEISIDDINNNGYVTEPNKCLELTGKMLIQAEKRKVKSGDILMITKSFSADKVGIVGLVGEDCDSNWVIGQNFHLIRLLDNEWLSDPIYLYMYLSSQLVKEYISEHVNQSVTSVLSVNDLRELPVSIEIESKEKVLRTRKEILNTYEKIEQLKKDIKNLKRKHWPLIVLKVLRMKDETWMFDIASDAEFTNCRSKYESIDDMPEAVKNKLAMLLHVPVAPGKSFPEIGGRPGEDVFWVYLTSDEWLALHKL